MPVPGGSLPFLCAKPAALAGDSPWNGRFRPNVEDTMRRSWLRTLAGAALVAAVVLMCVPVAQAQRMVRPGGVVGGYQTGGVYGSPYFGGYQGFGFGNYPGGYANYTYGNLG